MFTVAPIQSRPERCRCPCLASNLSSGFARVHVCVDYCSGALYNATLPEPRVKTFRPSLRTRLLTRSAAKLLTKDEARRIAASVAKLAGVSAKRDSMTVRVFPEQVQDRGANEFGSEKSTA
jgi:hypothetical protein